jgi:uncharacterized damage-inducible protein DinB
MGLGMGPMIATPGYFLQLYEYNAWANRHALHAAETLTPEQFLEQQGHSWGSVRSVLVHIMAAEWIWLMRWGGESPKSLFDFDMYQTVEQIRARWEPIQRDLSEFVGAQTADTLARLVDYKNTSGKSFRLPLWQLMAHVANHSNHHRGELAAMYAQMDIPHREDDLYYYFLIQSGQMEE